MVHDVAQGPKLVTAVRQVTRLAWHAGDIDRGRPGGALLAGWPSVQVAPPGRDSESEV